MLTDRPALSMFVSALPPAMDDARSGTARASGAQNGTAMSNALASTVVVVTGCGGPAGQATVRRLLTEGSVVVGADANAGALTALAQSLTAEQGARFHGQVVDLLDEAATRDWAEHAPSGNRLSTLTTERPRQWRNPMCRVLAFIGPETPLENLLLKPANSLVNQALDPERHPPGTGALT